MSGVADGLITIAIALLGLLGLGMSLCGGTVTLFSLRSLGDSWDKSFLVVSVPSLALGLLLLWLVRRLRARQVRERAAAAK